MYLNFHEQVFLLSVTSAGEDEEPDRDLMSCKKMNNLVGGFRQGGAMLKQHRLSIRSVRFLPLIPT